MDPEEEQTEQKSDEETKLKKTIYIESAAEIEEQLNMLHFSSVLQHEPSDCYKRMKKQLEEQQKPLFCYSFTNFKSKYTFEIG